MNVVTVVISSIVCLSFMLCSLTQVSMPNCCFYYVKYIKQLNHLVCYSYVIILLWTLGGKRVEYDCSWDIRHSLKIFLNGVVIGIYELLTFSRK